MNFEKTEINMDPKTKIPSEKFYIIAIERAKWDSHSLYCILPRKSRPF